METEKQAYEEAQKKRSLLKDAKKWQIVVSENMGWYWYLVKGKMTLHWSGYTKTFRALLSNSEYVAAGASFWTTSYHAKNPNLVVKNQLDAAKAFIKNCQASIDSVEK